LDGEKLRDLFLRGSENDRIMTEMEDFSDAALVVVGHGSTVNADSGKPARQHAEEIRRRGIFAEVRECFWKQDPPIREVMASLRERRIFVAPLFISEGYFSEQVVPRELGLSDGSPGPFARTREIEGRMIYYTSPVGTHPAMTRVLLARAAEIVRQFPFPRAPRPADTSLFIAGHGTENNASSRRAIEHQAEEIRRMNLYADVHAVFMEEEPRISDSHALAGTRHMIVVPFFISDGLHSQEDIPVLLGEAESVVKARLQAGQPPWRNPAEKKGKLIWYTPSIGSERQIADIILERVREAVAGGEAPCGAGSA
jgi:sirohydrochlorin cobaltochelatase